MARLEQRMAEASRWAWNACLFQDTAHPKAPKGLKVIPVKRVNEVQRVVF